MSYEIKKNPSDFIVKEKVNLNFVDNGKFKCYLLKKENWNTQDVVNRIADFLHIKKRFIGYAGSKDKQAITYQYISIPISQDLKNFKLKDVSLEFKGYLDEPISLGDLEGNYFEINVYTSKECGAVNKVINYFDEQRFSSQNVIVGKALILKQYKEVCSLLELEVSNNDYVGAIRTLPNRTLLFYVHSFQSYLWNKVVAKYVNSGKEVDYSLGKFVFGDVQDEKIPLVGFGTEFSNVEIEQQYKLILGEEGINERDFINQQIKFLTTYGSDREINSYVKEFGFENHGEYKKIEFFLNKGSYATIVVKYLFG